MTCLLRAKDLYKSFLSPEKVDILEGVSLEIHASQSIAIMGASGEGKTTLLHILGTLEQVDHGFLEVAGQRILPHSSCAEIRNRHIGFVFQSYHLLEDCSSLENVLMPSFIGRKKIGKNATAYQKALSLLEQMDLKNRIHFPVRLLSGGEKQRVALARALINDPELLFADEPSGNLDHLHSQRIHELLMSCVKQRGKSLLVVTHDEELASLCDQRYLLKQGHLQRIRS